jgi:hypothetical protein
MHNDVDEQHDSSAQIQPNIFSRIRNFNNLAMNSIGSLFSAPLSSQDGSTNFDSHDYDFDLWNYTYDSETAWTPNALEENNQFRVQDYHDIRTLTAEGSTPTQTRSNTPVRLNRFQDVKRIFTNLARSRQTGQMHFEHQLSDESQPPLVSSSMTPSSTASVSGSSSSDHFVTPPLTPDIIDDHILLSPAPSSYAQDIPYDPYRSAGHRIVTGFEHDEDMPYAQSHCLEIKEGKKPERLIVHGIPFCTNLLLLN